MAHDAAFDFFEHTDPVTSSRVIELSPTEWLGDMFVKNLPVISCFGKLIWETVFFYPI